MEVQQTTAPLIMSTSKLPNGSSCTCGGSQIPPSTPKSIKKCQKESSAQTNNMQNKETATQTITQWLQISLNSPPLALTQEVPDVAL